MTMVFLKLFEVPRAASRECRVIVLFEPENGAGSSWPEGFFEAIRIEDAAFARPPQGNAPTRRMPDSAGLSV